jgi:hypothetical protein
MKASLGVPMSLVWKGPAGVSGGAFGLQSDVLVAVVTASWQAQSVVTSVIAARAAFSSTMALSAA